MYPQMYPHQNNATPLYTHSYSVIDLESDRYSQVRPFGSEFEPLGLLCLGHPTKYDTGDGGKSNWKVSITGGFAIMFR